MITHCPICKDVLHSSGICQAYSQYQRNRKYHVFRFNRENNTYIIRSNIIYNNKITRYSLSIYEAQNLLWVEDNYDIISSRTEPDWSKGKTGIRQLIRDMIKLQTIEDVLDL